MYLQTIMLETSIFVCWRFLAIFLVELFRLYFAFSIDFRAELVKTDGRPLLGFDHLFAQRTVLLKKFSNFFG